MSKILQNKEVFGKIIFHTDLIVSMFTMIATNFWQNNTLWSIKDWKS